ncbi:uncharacterized protein TrAtP1_000333 [Trichoderma atroviride]|uniref:uncharacterized protein n=1 Tax=Hypocrea atroviridis TaxID=63577 RepID=UPI00331AB457|nr:hypothetical protein TrAtP1_000333 [Trichoderma atroviride]
MLSPSREASTRALCVDISQPLSDLPAAAQGTGLSNSSACSRSPSSHASVFARALASEPQPQSMDQAQGP